MWSNNTIFWIENSMRLPIISNNGDINFSVWFKREQTEELQNLLIKEVSLWVKNLIIWATLAFRLVILIRNMVMISRMQRSTFNLTWDRTMKILGMRVSKQAEAYLKSCYTSTFYMQNYLCNPLFKVRKKHIKVIKKKSWMYFFIV